MTDPHEALSEHAAYERGATGHELTTTPFEAVVEVEENGETVYHVVVRLPTLDAVVEGETVAQVVEDGWFETLERRLEGPEQVTSGLESIDSEVRREGDEVRVELTFSSATPERAAENAKSLVEFVEGTWVQGIVPGYEYGEPAASLLDRATRNYDDGGA
ncbi:hypothetical protein HAPAU_13590 [Halalkalicoccus paucihalophilus]|uniref:Uncharacterized protein n=1 Tax=Halalkalicoccus paucihalophilus TaxID=1008153 RepID=A0A151AFC7_9EURY|nr:DUF5813 family protein [Halalkalicoccus paucihalophilus]KYH26264.1 hypothetical protein HAPAU_13590 [Halalkalicoccus paucihalophilus]